MKRRIKNLALSSVSVILLLVFTFTSCSSPFLNNLPAETNTYVVEVGKGTPYFTYLDADYNPVQTVIGKNDPDPGKTAFWADDNPMAEGVMLISETFDDSDDVVRINNDNTGCFLSMFFHKGESFPWAFDIQIGDKQGGARLSSYDNDNQRYSITFQMEGEYFTLDNVALNRSILSAYTDDANLTEDQNTRMRNIYTALGVYVSIEQAFPSDQEVIALWGGWLNPLNWDVFDWIKIAVTAVAVIVVAVVAFVCPPAVFVEVTAVVQQVLPVVYQIIDGLEESLKAQYTSSPVPQVASARILKDGSPVSPDTVYYLPPGGEMEFDISLLGFGNVIARLYEPTRRIYHQVDTEYNSVIFTFTNAAGDRIGGLWQTPAFKIKEHDKIKVARNSIPGYFFDGTIDVAILFNERTIVNDSSEGIDFYVPNSDGSVKDPSEPPVRTDSVFLLHFAIDDLAGGVP
ncbi:MAG: hypothetical protein LBQ14_00200 [Treponema sp.]|nr:hypothetical protein [Treponema sp.]